MRETRVNLKHLLEDIRDSYTIPLEEAIVVELIANALDSKASSISFFIEPAKNTLTVVDNGRGMHRRELSDYHNIASTTKIRGRGIGFAGIGTKLSLLIASSVLTETKGGYGARCATEWYLKSETSAPWKFVPFSGKVLCSRGTAVTINFANSKSLLLSEEFITKTVLSHYYPFFQSQFFQIILKHIYKKGVEFFVNNKEISFSQPIPFSPRVFQIRLGGRQRRLVGVGYLAKVEESDSSQKTNFEGLGISTYGKVIKSGWEWIGIGPKENFLIQGIVEIPALSEILTTNKMDFLRDTTSLKKYYRYRKAIQEVIYPILREFGQETGPKDQKKQFLTLSKAIERALRYVLGDFPELIPLLGLRKTKIKGPSFVSEKELPLVAISQEKEKSEQNEEKTKEKGLPSSEKPSKTILSNAKKKQGKQGPALSIGFEERGEKEALARMVENKIWINSLHPAYLKAQKEGFEQYHILFSVGWVLSNFLEDNRSPQTFINNFLASWGKSEKATTRLLKI